MTNYSIAMGIRMVCVILCFFVQGWWLLVMAIGAVALPYFAVLLANKATASGGAAVQRPGGIVVYGPAEPLRVVPMDDAAGADSTAPRADA